MTGQVSRGSAGEYQADEQAGVARLSWRVKIEGYRDEKFIYSDLLKTHGNQIAPGNRKDRVSAFKSAQKNRKGKIIQMR